MWNKPPPENRIIDQNMLTPIRNYLMRETYLIHEGKKLKRQNQQNPKRKVNNYNNYHKILFANNNPKKDSEKKNVFHLFPFLLDAYPWNVTTLKVVSSLLYSLLTKYPDNGFGFFLTKKK